MDIRFLGLDSPLLHTGLHDMLESDAHKSAGGPTRTYVLDAKAMAATPVDVKEHPNSYVFVVDMPGLKPGDIKVQVRTIMCFSSAASARGKRRERGRST
ncbi:UNVERIFIED_CONTAM: class II heat shock protein [Sesamum radiatum]|uniref:Class II heat shock protein n=1 Tax=Sesamum radiatum TaxID=300843 RepID=A0AAW2JSQ0_SESRA